MPVAFVTAMVVFAFVVAAVPISMLARPLLVGAFAALLCSGVAFFLLRDVARSGLWATVFAAAVFGQFVIAVLFGAVAILLRGRVLAGMRGETVAVLVSGVASLVVLGMLLATATSTGAFATKPIAVPRIVAALQGDDRPNISVLLLDGYPRQDTLESEFQIDNEWFLTGLEDRGFDVYRDSHSNYDQTPFTLLSMLSLRHVVDVEGLSGVSGSNVQQQRLNSRALLDPPLFDLLEEAGYTTRVLASPIVSAQVGGADVTWSSGAATDFELNLLQRTLAAGVTSSVGWETRQERDGIIATLDEFARPLARPTFTLGHVMAPHAPFVLRNDGSAEAAPPCYPAVCGFFHGYYNELGLSTIEYRERLAGQVASLNRLVLATLDRIHENDPKGVVLVLSDHGLRFDRADRDERFRNLLTAYTPGHASLFGSKPTLVNVMPQLLNAYFDAGVPLLTDSIYSGRVGEWLVLKPTR